LIQCGLLQTAASKLSRNGLQHYLLIKAAVPTASRDTRLSHKWARGDNF